jgi:hypothetical protein
MLIKYIILGLPIIALLLISCSSTKELNNSIFENTETKVYEVFGMDCPGCHGGLEKLLNQHEAIVGSKADWVNKRVTIYIKLDSEISENEIFELIKRANFTPGKLINKL